MANTQAQPDKTNSNKTGEKVPDVTAEEIRRKEIAPHEGATIGPSPTGNIQDSQIPPVRRAV